MKARALVLFVVLAACDDRQAFHDPNPTWARMLDQKRVDPWEQPMRSPPPGTVPADDDEDKPPPKVTRELVELGRAKFQTICATCHGMRGDGKSVVATKMENRPPPSLHEARLRDLPRERIFAVATGGYGMMPGFAAVLDANERWAVASYVKALQLSQGARVADLPDDVKKKLYAEAK